MGVPLLFTWATAHVCTGLCAVCIAGRQATSIDWLIERVGILPPSFACRTRAQEEEEEYHRLYIDKSESAEDYIYKSSLAGLLLLMYFLPYIFGMVTRWHLLLLLFHFNVLSFLYFGQLGLFGGTHEINFVAPFQKSVVPPPPSPFNHEREISSSTGIRRRVYNYGLSLLSEVTRLLLFSFPNVWLLYTYGLFTCQKARSSSRSRKKRTGGHLNQLNWVDTHQVLRALVFHVFTASCRNDRNSHLEWMPMCSTTGTYRLLQTPAKALVFVERITFYRDDHHE